MSAKIPRLGPSVPAAEVEIISEVRSPVAPFCSCDGPRGEGEEDGGLHVVGLCPVSLSEAVKPGGLQQVALKCSCHPLHPPSEEQRLQLQLKQMQKVLHEQNALLFFLSPGQMLSHTFSTQFPGHSPGQCPEMDSVIHTSNRARQESEEAACSQAKHKADQVPPEPASTKRSLSPVEEECSESVEENSSISPFGVRRIPPANPEERPICPGLKEKEKTFEDLVEEQLRVDKLVQRPHKQIITGERGTEKRSFLRKGDGRSRTGKSRDGIEKIQSTSSSQKAKHMDSVQLQRTSASSLQHSDTERWIKSSHYTELIRSTALQCSSMKMKCEGKHPSGQRSAIARLQSKSIPSHDVKEQGSGAVVPSDERQTSCVLQAWDPDGKSCQKCEEHSKEPIMTGELKNKSLCQSYAKPSNSKGDFKASPYEERVSFKKINDHIVRVCGRKGHSPCSLDGHAIQAEPSLEKLSLTTEVMQLVFDSNSSDSSSDEDNIIISQSRFPTPSNASKLELSDEDYASDAPSETGDSPQDRVKAPHCVAAQFSSSSDSEEASHSELQCLSWSETEKNKANARAHQTENKRATEDSGGFITSCSSDLLNKIFPQISSTRQDKADSGHLGRDCNAQHSANGNEPSKKVLGKNDLGTKATPSTYLMMDKMKTEQDKALTFIRTEMDQLANKKSPKSSHHTPEDKGQEFNKPQDLRQQIESLKAQLNKRECEWWQVHSELQSRVDALTRENQLLLSQSPESAECKRPNHSTDSTSPHTGSPVTSAEGSEASARVGSVSHRRSSTPALRERNEATTAGNMLNKLCINRGQEKKEWETCSISRDSSNSRESTKSLSPEESDTVPYSNNRAKVSFLSPGMNNSYMPFAAEGSKAVVMEEVRYPDGKIEQLLSDGSRVIVFRNGTKKEIGVDPRSVTVTFFNGDVKHTFPDGTVVYCYCDSQTTHSTYPSGLEILEFPNNQKEKHYPDGKREVFFPDGTVKTMYPDGQQESIFPDGTVVKLSKNGEKTVQFTNGQREIHTAQYKQRVYPDGTVKTVFLNGRQETKYSSGRVNLKNNEGNIFIDKK
ncbi:centromere protein J isoform X2 [Hoplias malabaricus]|uniref:centromere protein J isoform X2 n=1 Tax=Hoplias malabaricus TaxID=27720 RepID=UPI00346363D5